MPNTFTLESVIAERDSLKSANLELLELLKSTQHAFTIHSQNVDDKSFNDAFEKLNESIKKWDGAFQPEEAEVATLQPALPVDPEHIRSINGELLTVLCKTLSVLQSKDLSGTPGLYDEIPWADMEGVIEKAGIETIVAQTPLNEFQRRVAETYAHGEFSHVQTLEETRNCGDGLFRFLMHEAGDDAADFDEVIARYELAQREVDEVLTGLHESVDGKPRP